MYKKGDKVRVIHPGAIKSLTTGNAYPTLCTGQILTVARDQTEANNLDVIVGDEIIGYYPQRFVPATFTKADLKTGMRVQYRGGNERVVVGEDLWQVRAKDKPSWAFALAGFDSQLEHPANEMTVVKVWAAPDKCEDFFNIKVKGALLFERFEPPVKTQQELEYDQLMAKIEELKQQAEKLKPSA